MNCGNTFMNNCCIECFEEPVIKEFIESEGQHGECEYCDSQNVFVSDTETVGNFIREGLARAYEHVESAGVYWDSESKEYTAGETVDEILFHDEPIFSEKLFNQNNETTLVNDLMADSAPNWRDSADGADDWLDGGSALIVPRNDFYGPDHNKYKESWESFKEHVKFHGRFFNFSDDDSREALLGPVTEFFPKLEGTLHKDTTLFRARIVSGVLPNDEWELQDALGPAPVRNASHSRMSPAGISYMYLSDDVDTCITEVRSLVGEEVWVASFELKKDLKILDFTKIPEVKIPSIFDSNYDHNLRWASNFIDEFLRELSQPPTSHDDLLEYVPTQVLAEFVRSLEYEGIKYTSSQNPAGINYTLFCSPGHDYENGYWPKRPKFNDWMFIKQINTLAVTSQIVGKEQIESRDIKPEDLKDPEENHEF